MTVDSQEGDSEQIKRHVHRLDTTPVDEFPLFMQSLPQKADGEKNIPLEALQALLYEGTPEGQAINFKNQGNECYVLGTPLAVRDALRYYTRGLEAGSSDMDLNAHLWLNRSAANMALQNWGDSIQDSQRALQIIETIDNQEGKIDEKSDDYKEQSTHNHKEKGDGHEDDESKKPIKTDYKKLREKAWRRILKSSLTIERAQEARAAMTFLQSHSLDVPVEQANRLIALEQQIAHRNELCQAEEQRRARLKEFVQGMGIEVVPGCEEEVFSQFNRSDNGSSLDVNLLPWPRRTNTGSREWPIILFYPLEAQSDLIEAMDEKATFQSLLKMVFGNESQLPEWDSHGKRYGNIAALSIYRVAEDNLIQIPLKTRLRDLFPQVIRKIDYGLLAFHVCPTAEASAFTSRFSHVINHQC